jgi:hypothetical protein
MTREASKDSASVTGIALINTIFKKHLISAIANSLSSDFDRVLKLNGIDTSDYHIATAIQTESRNTAIAAINYMCATADLERLNRRTRDVSRDVYVQFSISIYAYTPAAYTQTCYSHDTKAFDLGNKRFIPGSSVRRVRVRKYLKDRTKILSAGVSTEGQCQVMSIDA